MWLSIILILRGIMTFQSQRGVRTFCWKKNINFSKNETDSKIKNSTHTFRDTFFVPFILSNGNFFNICVITQCIVYWINFQNLHTFTYQKTLLRALSCLFLKPLKAFSVSLMIKRILAWLLKRYKRMLVHQKQYRYR